MVLYFITGNPGKFSEAKSRIPEIEQLNLDLPELQELDPKKVLEAKLHAAASFHEGDEFFIEDTCMHFEGLGGFPGPLVKWFHQSMGNSGFLDLTEKLQNNKVVISAVIGYGKRVNGKLETHFFEGRLLGTLVPVRGTNDFEWGNMFLPEGFVKTFGEMTREEKLPMSHRGLALTKFKEFLDRN